MLPNIFKALAKVTSTASWNWEAKCCKCL